LAKHKPFSAYDSDMSSAELDAFVAECEALEATLAGVPEDAWHRHGLGEWTLAELVAHITRGAGRLAEYAREEPGADRPARDRVSYWRTDLEAEAPAIAARAREAAAGVNPAEWPDRFAGAWRASADTFVRIGPEALIPTIAGPMRAVEYLATRIVELVVHHHDVRAALDLPPAATPEAERITMDVLEALLEGSRPRNFGRRRFILAATGRLRVDDARFPVLR
jgi:uncharacterized protein (TIGR03083 family)